MTQIVLDRGRVHDGDLAVAVNVGCRFTDCKRYIYIRSMALNPRCVPDLYITVKVYVAEDNDGMRFGRFRRDFRIDDLMAVVTIIQLCFIVRRLP